MTETILKGTVKDVLAGKILPDAVDRNTARLVLWELQAGRCKGNPKRLLARLLGRIAMAGGVTKVRLSTGEFIDMPWKMPTKAAHFMEVE